MKILSTLLSLLALSLPLLAQTPAPRFTEQTFTVETASPAELRGVTKVFVYTGAETAERERLVKTLQKKLPQLIFIERWQEAEVALDLKVELQTVETGTAKRLATPPDSLWLYQEADFSGFHHVVRIEQPETVLSVAERTLNLDKIVSLEVPESVRVRICTEPGESGQGEGQCASFGPGKHPNITRRVRAATFITISVPDAEMVEEPVYETYINGGGLVFKLLGEDRAQLLLTQPVAKDWKSTSTKLAEAFVKAWQAANKPK